MNEADYLREDATGLAALIARREISAAEALEAALARAAKVNPKLNAITMDLSERARREAAGALSGPLAGVPFLLKDLGARRWPARPLPAPRSSTRRTWRRPTARSPPSTARPASSIFGKTNTPELGLEPVTEPDMFGPTRNPWDLTRTSGGSSGGAAAAVAARHRAGRPRQRRRRLDPHPGLVLRPLRPEAVARAGLGRAEGRGLGRLLVRPRGQPFGARQRRCCSTSPASRSRAIPTGRRRRPSRS